MSTTQVQNLTNVGDIQDSDKLVGERVDGTTVRITFNGVLYDADFSANGLMTRTASGTYANRTITGTAGTITVTDGDGVSGNPTLTIDSSYVGQNTITTLGTVTTGTWNGDVLSVAYGGSNRTSATAYALIAGGTTSTGAHQSLGTGSSGQVLQSNGASALPTYSTATYPTTTTANRILYSSSNDVIGQITSANSSLLMTDGSGVPSFGTDIPTAVTIGSAYVYRAGGTDIPVADGGTGVSSMTEYAIVTGGTTSTGALQQVSGVGSSGQALVSAGASALPAWGTLGVNGGGTGVTSNTAYAVLCGGTTSTGAIQSVASVGTSGYVLTSNGAGALPTFQAAPGGTPSFQGISISRGSNQSITTATFTKVQLNSETYDTEGDFDSTTNYRWTPLTAGKYLVTAGIYYASMSDAKLVYCSIYKNGSVIASRAYHTGSATDITATCTTIVDMNGSTDYIELYCYHNNGSNINITNTTNMQGYLAGV